MNRISKSIDGYTYLCYGNDTISNSLINYGYWENSLIQYVEKHLTENSVILDIGANIGTWSIPLSNKENRKIYSFEPYNSSYQALCGNIFINNKTNIIPFHCALTDSTNINKNLKMILPEAINIGGCKLVDTSSSIYQLGSGVALETGELPVELLKLEENEQMSQIQKSSTRSAVRNDFMLKTLDSFDFEKIDFIKLDVEGHELNVLMGGVNTILKYKPIIMFECWSLNSIHWTGIPNTYNQLMDYIKYKLGYTINKIEIDGIDNYEAIPIIRDQ